MGRKTKTAARRDPLAVAGLTPERARQAAAGLDAIVLDETMTAGVRRARVISQRMIDRYLVQGHLSQRQHDAAMRLYNDWRASGSEPTTVAGYGPSQRCNGEITDWQAQRNVYYREAVNSVGKRHFSLVFAVVCLDTPVSEWAIARGFHRCSGMPMLVTSLETLGDYYGMPERHAGIG